MKSDAFVEAIHARSREQLEACFAPDARFLSPVVFAPYEGRDVVLLILTEGAMKVFEEDFHYVHRFESEDAAALVFKATVDDREVDGLDLLQFNSDGLITELKVMVRPMSGLHRLAEKMGERFEALGLVAPKA
ncbi:MAG TPA: nuclear transport factor 2 family protein [Solirubrobacterales bacterium]|nr:nuclear transport factor 2 family protein [Solirubrobacterales bacterium]